MWERLENVDLSSMHESAMPPLALLNYLHDHKKRDHYEIPFVELSTMCVPEWST
jgi:hypothetical protein